MSEITGKQTTPPKRQALQWWLAAPLAVLGGLALDAATPWLEWWFAAPIGVALILASVWQQRTIAGLCYGLLAGASFWLPHIFWLTLYLGPIPWLALSTVMIAWFGLFGLLAAVTTHGLSVWFARRKTPTHPLFLVLVQSLSVTGLWVAREQLQSTWPYGGFAWGRLAHTQADSPFTALVSWLGFAGLSALICLISALVTALLFQSSQLSTRRTVILVLSVLLVASGLSLVTPAAQQQESTIRVAAIQGNSSSGIFDDRENGDVIRDHIEATRDLLSKLEDAGEQVDVIVWPENSGEFQLPEQHFRSLEVQRLAQRAGAPIVTGTILQDSEVVFTNSSVVFDEQGVTGERYDKRRPVPFAEYMPNRSFFHALVPDLVNLVQLDYAFGTRSSVLTIENGTESFSAGIAICFDVIFDDHAVAMNADGAEIVFAQTNNADFGRTDESAQQLQIARLRAVEMGRTLVNISTVGTSAIVLPSGKLEASLEPFTAGAMVAEVPLYSGSTPALRYGALIAGAWLLAGLLGAAAGAFGLWRGRNKPHFSAE